MEQKDTVVIIVLTNHDHRYPPPRRRWQRENRSVQRNDSQQTQTKICPFWLLKGENLGSCDTFPYQHWIVRFEWLWRNETSVQPVDRKRFKYSHQTVLLCEGVGVHVHMHTTRAHACTFVYNVYPTYIQRIYVINHVYVRNCAEMSLQMFVVRKWHRARCVDASPHKRKSYMSNLRPRGEES